MAHPFILVTPATRGISLALTRLILRSTSFPVYATYRAAAHVPQVHESILQGLGDVDPTRLKLLKLDLSSESSIQSTAETLRSQLPDGSYMKTGFFTGGVLFPEKHPSEINSERLQETFQVNVISHLLLIKHFSCFLPNSSFRGRIDGLSHWVHVSARVGSISDNMKGGWYSYRSSKAALNQVVKTFDNQLKMQKLPAICVGVHPGTVKTGLSKDFWNSVPKDQLFEPEYAAEKLISVVDSLKECDRGMVWDYARKQVPWFV